MSRHGKVPSYDELTHDSQVTEAQVCALRALTPSILRMSKEERQRKLLGNPKLQDNLRRALELPAEPVGFRLVKRIELGKVSTKKVGECFQSPWFDKARIDPESGLRDEQYGAFNDTIGVFHVDGKHTVTSMLLALLGVPYDLLWTGCRREIFGNLFTARRHSIALPALELALERQLKCGEDIGLSPHRYTFAFISAKSDEDELYRSGVAVCRLRPDNDSAKRWTPEIEPYGGDPVSTRRSHDYEVSFPSCTVFVANPDELPDRYCC